MHNKKIDLSVGDLINLRKNQDNTLTANIKGKEVTLDDKKG